MGTEKITPKTQTTGQQELQGGYRVEYLGGKKDGVKLTHINEDIILLENINPKTKNINFVYNKFREDLRSGNKLLLQEGKDKSKMMLVSSGVYERGDWWEGMGSYWTNKSGKNEMGKDIAKFYPKLNNNINDKWDDATENLFPNLLPKEYLLESYCRSLNTFHYVGSRYYKSVAKKLAKEYFELFNKLPKFPKSSESFRMFSREHFKSEEEFFRLQDTFKSLEKEGIKEIRRVLINDYKMNPKDIGF